MLEQLDLTLKIPKPEYKRYSDPLGLKLFELQHQIRESGIPMILVFEGWDAAGKGVILNHLIRHLDPRGYKVQSLDLMETRQVKGRPFLWPSWIRTPHRGYISIFDHSWYQQIMQGRIEGYLPEPDVADAMSEINSFERWLVDDGFILLKFWLHISKKTQKSRLERMESDKLESWKVTPEDWHRHNQYKEYLVVIEDMLQRCSTTAAPWILIEAEDKYFARLKVYENIAKAMESAIERNRHSEQPGIESAPEEPIELRTVAMENTRFLSQIDLSQRMNIDKYRKRLDDLQHEMRNLHHRMFIEKRAAIIVFEGWDASGKGGAIRRLLEPLDPRGFNVVSISAPTPHEKAKHYLWRFWNEIPTSGFLTVFDRSWYGRVLVERIEHFCSHGEWYRAYREINEFEKMLTRAGIIVVKFWLHIDRDEQKQRFDARREIAHKRWKITDEDFRNREKWSQYELAVAEMIKKTSTTYAPWTIVPSNDKLGSRIKVIETVSMNLKRILAESKIYLP